MGANLICHSVYVTVFPIVTEFEALIITSTVLIIALHVLNYNNIHGVVQKYHVRLKFLNFTMFLFTYTLGRSVFKNSDSLEELRLQHLEGCVHRLHRPCLLEYNIFYEYT